MKAPKGPFRSRAIKPKRGRYDAVVNLLSQAFRNGGTDANIEVEYDQQWRTVWKAHEMGLITEYDSGCQITPKGITFYNEKAV